jgi:alkylhydroperoxidase/carboxymuconolactone decarboxylase family protein YurZ
MEDDAPRYPSYKPDTEHYDEPPASLQVTPYQLRPQAERSVPLFLSDRDGVPDPSEYASRPAGSVKLGSYYTSRILVGAVGGALLAAFAALVTSDSARDVVASAKASSAAALAVASVVMQPGPERPKAAEIKTPEIKATDIKAADIQLKETASPSGLDSQTPAAASVAVAAATPTPDDIKTAYQGALQGSAPQTAAAPDAAVPAEPIHHLDPSEIAALLKRADSLIASGDVAAARLVLRRAAEAADARAAMMLAGTYDPTVLEKLGVHGVVPDLVMARSWYEKARRFGAPEASSQLDRLATRQH